MLKWFKDLNIIVKSFIGIVIAFAAVCIGIYFTVLSEVPSPITDDQWVTIISTFFAGTLGGLIALGGIWWQLNHEKDKKRENLKKYLNYVISENKKNIVERLGHIQTHFAYNRTIQKVPGLYEGRIEYLSEFKKNYFDDNFEGILELKRAEDLIDLNYKIINLNEYFSINFHNTNNKRKAYEALAETTTLKKIINEYSQLLVSINNSNMFIQKISSLERIRQSLEYRRNKSINEIHLEKLNKFVNELIRKFQEEKKIDTSEKLIFLTEINKTFLEFIYTECYKVNSIEAKEVSNYINYDLANVNLSLEIYDLIKKLNNNIQ